MAVMKRIAITHPEIRMPSELKATFRQFCLTMNCAITNVLILFLVISQGIGDRLQSRILLMRPHLRTFIQIVQRQSRLLRCRRRAPLQYNGNAPLSSQLFDTVQAHIECDQFPDLLVHADHT